MPISRQTTLYGKLSPTVSTKQVADANRFELIGMKFDFSEAGFLKKSTKNDLLKGQLQQLLNTEPGERVMLPEFGVPLYKHVFANLDKPTVDEIKESIVEAVRRFVPNAVIIDIFVNSFENNIGSMTLSIRLTVKHVDSQDILQVIAQR
jgi:uncharacterized protein